MAKFNFGDDRHRYGDDEQNRDLSRVSRDETKGLGNVKGEYDAEAHTEEWSERTDAAKNVHISEDVSKSVRHENADMAGHGQDGEGEYTWKNETTQEFWENQFAETDGEMRDGWRRGKSNTTHSPGRMVVSILAVCIIGAIGYGFLNNAADSVHFGRDDPPRSDSHSDFPEFLEKEHNRWSTPELREHRRKFEAMKKEMEKSFGGSFPSEADWRQLEQRSRDLRGRRETEAWRKEIEEFLKRNAQTESDRK